MFIDYDPDAPFPQTPQVQRGVEIAGKYTPPEGMSAFETPDDMEFVYGSRNDDIERFYDVAAGPSLRAKPQTQVDAIKQQDAEAAKKARLKARAREVALDRIVADVEADIDRGDIKDEQELRSTERWKNPGNLTR